MLPILKVFKPISGVLEFFIIQMIFHALLMMIQLHLQRIIIQHIYTMIIMEVTKVRYQVILHTSPLNGIKKMLSTIQISNILIPNITRPLLLIQTFIIIIRLLFFCSY